ncbi:MAG TPA: branched-chain amino acid ABC transporter permease [Nitrososphaerales archaeon]|nr:branched-chain amino acid ABC transporter permease [Nitrososphaerales archaeon]
MFWGMRITWITTLVILVALAFLPFLTTDQFVLSAMITVLIFALFGASWDLSYGVAGLLNLGPGVSFGVGGFALTYLAKSHYPPVVAVFFAAVIAASTGILIWIPSIRMSGAYLGIVTLAILLLFSDIALIWTGEEGVPIGIHYFNATLQQSYYYALILSGVGMFALYALSGTRFGLQARAMKDDEAAAKSISINIPIYKLASLIVSSFFLGLAGAYYTLYISNVNYTIFSINTNFLGVVISILGGSGTILGSIIGSLIVQLPSQYLVSYGSYSIILYGATMILVMLFLRGGILQGVEYLASKLNRNKSK